MAQIELIALAFIELPLTNSPSLSSGLGVEQRCKEESCAAALQRNANISCCPFKACQLRMKATV